MLSGHLREKNNTYYAVLNCKHSDGKRYSKWVSTGIAVKKGNKRTAEKKLEELFQPVARAVDPDYRIVIRMY